MGLPGSSWLINNYPTKDGKWVAVSASNRQVLNRVLKLIGGENLLADERFNGEQVFRHMDELDVITADWIRERECKDVIQSFVDAGAVAAPVYDIRDIFHDEQYAARDDILEMEDEELGRIRMLGVIPKFPQRPGQIRWTGKEMGFFNREIYCDLLGMSLEELASLKAEGIV